MKIKKSNIGLMILSVVLSFMLWLVVMSRLDPESSQTVRGIPVVYEGESVLNDRKLSIINTSTTTVNVTFSGKRSDLAKLDPTTVSAVLDLSSATTTGNLAFSPTFKLPAGLQTRVTSYAPSPSFVTLNIDTITSAVLPVRILDNMTVAEGYKRGIAVLDPPDVRVTGPTAIIGTLRYAALILEGEDVDQSIDTMRSFTPRDEKGLTPEYSGFTYDVSSVHVTVPIKKTKVVKLAVDFKDGGGITQAGNVDYEISPDSVTISGDAATLEGVNTIIVGQIDLSLAEGDGNYEFDIIPPNGCESVSGETTAAVDIKIHGTKTRAIGTIIIETVNAGELPEGFKLSLITKAVQVRIRGPESEVDAVQPYQVRVVADLTDIQLQGQITAPAVVYIDGGGEVGAIGTYTVSLNVVADTDTPS
ncbi:hypothetical protein FACS1894202_05410 [Clostridia bacterium]|nr:hypothetical protein FACS1894202_05410 [Clostridia bacterium]